jgi:ribosomal-protein-alanine N-acetyltransferase
MINTLKNAITISPASWRDLGELKQLEKACFPIDTWPLIDLVAVLTFPNVVRLKAVDHDKIIGFVAGDKRKSNNLAWIATIGVLPSYQRFGIGTMLLEACENQLGSTRIRLSVRVTNKPAIRLYQRFGYHRIDTWERYYEDGSDAAVFEKNIGSGL